MRSLVALVVLVPLVAGSAGAVVRHALALASISEKAAAIEMGMGLPQASRQLSGEEHLHLDRWMAVEGLAPWIGVALAVDAGLPPAVDRMVALRMARMTLVARERKARA